MRTFKYSGTQHWQTCSPCGYTTAKTAHTLAYKHNSTQHWQECSTCGYKGIASDHTFTVYGNCSVCHYIKDAGVMDNPDLPQDDFAVLCLDPEDDFREIERR